MDWDERYRRGEAADEKPHPLFVEFVSDLKPGRALDVACGLGRHALWLAGRGWRVTAVDSSRVAIEILRQRSAEQGVIIESHVADLECREFSIEPNSYDLIVICNYLQRDLFAPIKAGIREGGTALIVIPMVDDNPNIKPMNPAYLLGSGELRSEFEGWELIHYSESRRAAGRRTTAEMIARRRFGQNP